MKVEIHVIQIEFEKLDISHIETLDTMFDVDIDYEVQQYPILTQKTTNG